MASDTAAPHSHSSSRSSTLHDVEAGPAAPAAGDFTGEPKEMTLKQEGQHAEGRDQQAGHDENMWETEQKPWYHHALFIASCISGQSHARSSSSSIEGDGWLILRLLDTSRLQVKLLQ